MIPSPLAGSHYQLLPHNTEEKPKPEKIQKILALVLTSTLVGRFSLLSDCEVYLKARNFCLLSPPECKFHVVPPVHWHPYIESSCFPVLGWFFECLTSGVASPLSVWTLTLPWHLPCSHGGLLCLLLLLLSLPCLSLSDYYPHEYCHSQAYALCCWLYKDPVWSVFCMPRISTTSDAPAGFPSLYSSDLSSETQSHKFWDLLDMATSLTHWRFWCLDWNPERITPLHLPPLFHIINLQPASSTDYFSFQFSFFLFYLLTSHIWLLLILLLWFLMPIF